MKHRKLWIAVTLLAVLAVAAVIFSFSAQAGEDSDRLGISLVEPPLLKLWPSYGTMDPEARLSLRDAVVTAVRKLAHFCEFGLLGFCLMAHLQVLRWEKPVRPTGLMAWVIATLYAGSDELHQHFVSDRSPELRDVGIDSAGALCGILLMALLFWLLARRARKSGG